MNQQYLQKGYPKSQAGVALIIVLIVLLLISILGIIVLRKSTTDLQVATASQISQLMFQANDDAFGKVEKQFFIVIIFDERREFVVSKGYVNYI